MLECFPRYIPYCVLQIAWCPEVVGHAHTCILIIVLSLGRCPGDSRTVRLRPRTSRENVACARDYVVYFQPLDTRPFRMTCVHINIDHNLSDPTTTLLRRHFGTAFKASCVFGDNAIKIHYGFSYLVKTLFAFRSCTKM